MFHQRSGFSKSQLVAYQLFVFPELGQEAEPFRIDWASHIKSCLLGRCVTRSEMNSLRSGFNSNSKSFCSSMSGDQLNDIVVALNFFEVYHGAGMKALPEHRWETTSWQVDFPKLDCSDVVTTRPKSGRMRNLIPASRIVSHLFKSSAHEASANLFSAVRDRGTPII